MIGLYLIAYSILFFDAKTPHPSFYTLLPIVGVALIIGFASKDELVGKVLGSKPLVLVGLVSYSAYLWHFPLFAFSRREENPSNYDIVELNFLTFILATISYHFIERPFRKKMGRGMFFIFHCPVSLFINRWFVIAKQYEGFAFRYKYQMNLSLDVNEYAQNHKRFAQQIQKKTKFDDQKINVLFVGNSHARDLLSAFYQNRDRLDGFNLRRGNITQISCF